MARSERRSGELRPNCGTTAAAMAVRYQHVTAPVFEGVAARVGELLWGVVEQPTETKTETEAPRRGEGA
jgi:hypothetical protein